MTSEEQELLEKYLSHLSPNPPKGSSRADRTGDERREQAEVRV